MSKRFAAVLCALAMLFGVVTLAAPAASAGSYMRYQCIYATRYWVDVSYYEYQARRANGEPCRAGYY